MNPRLDDPGSNKSVAETRDNVGQRNIWANAFVKFFLYLSKGFSDGTGMLPSAALETLKELPVVSSFISGLVILHQGWEAYQNKQTPQRWTKIGAGLVGGLVSLGLGTAGALIIAGILFAAPFILPALTIVVYSAALYRDLYICYQVRQKLINVRTQINALETANNPQQALELEGLRAQEKQLEKDYSKAKTNAFISFLLVAGFAIALGAVFATGIGGAVIAGIASAVIVGAISKRIWTRYKEKQALKTAAALELQEKEKLSEEEGLTSDLGPQPSPKAKVDLAVAAGPMVEGTAPSPLPTTENALSSPAGPQGESAVETTAEPPLSPSSQSVVTLLLEIPLPVLAATLQPNAPDDAEEKTSSNDPVYAKQNVQERERPEEVKSEGAGRKSSVLKA